MFRSLDAKKVGVDFWFTTDDEWYPIDLKIFGEKDKYHKLIIEFNDLELIYDKGKFIYRGIDYSRGPGGYPASGIYETPKIFFPIEKFYEKFEESSKTLDSSIKKWVLEIMKKYRDTTFYPTLPKKEKTESFKLIDFLKSLNS
jgi:hypothetical protein